MPQQLFVPSLGTLLMLAEDWTFKLYLKDRNDSMIEVFGGKKKQWWSRHRSEIHPEQFEGNQIPDCVEYEQPMSEEELANAYKSFQATNARENPFIRVTLKKGTQLKVDRIYIRRGAESFNSITFRTTKVGPEKRFYGKRFWVKLRDANTLIADVIG